MKKPNTKKVQQNLRIAMHRKGVGSRALQDRIRARYGDLRGSSYGALELYRQGKVRNPRIEVLEAVADVLGFRPEWLIWNDGEPTEAEERLAAVARGELPNPDSEPESFVQARIDIAFPEFENFHLDSKSLVYEAIARFGAAMPPEWLDADGRIHPDLYDVFLLGMRGSVVGPLKMWWDEPEWGSRVVRDYLRAAVNAFILSIPEELKSPPRHAHLAVTQNEREQPDPTEDELRDMVQQLREAARSRGFDIGL